MTLETLDIMENIRQAILKNLMASEKPMMLVGLVTNVRLMVKTTEPDPNEFTMAIIDALSNLIAAGHVDKVTIWDHGASLYAYEINPIVKLAAL